MDAAYTEEVSRNWRDYIDTSQPSLWIAVASCLFNPVRTF